MWRSCNRPFKCCPVKNLWRLPYRYILLKNVSGDATPDLLLLIQQKLHIVQYRYCSLSENLFDSWGERRTIGVTGERILHPHTPFQTGSASECYFRCAEQLPSVAFCKSEFFLYSMLLVMNCLRGSQWENKTLTVGERHAYGFWYD